VKEELKARQRDREAAAQAQVQAQAQAAAAPVENSLANQQQLDFTASTTSLQINQRPQLQQLRPNLSGVPGQNMSTENT